MKTNSRKALLGSLISLLLCFTMLIGSTFAWFTDTVTAGKNKIVAGNLDLNVKYLDDKGIWQDLEKADSLFSVDLWEPGHTEVAYLMVENLGTLAFNYRLDVSPISESGGINVYGDNFKLSDHLVFATTEPVAGTENFKKFDDRTAARDAAGTTTGLNQASLKKDGTILPKKGETEAIPQYIALVVYMPETVGNVANYKTGTDKPYIELGITVVASQEDYESDSFGPTYDENATYPDGSDALTNDYFPMVSESRTVSAEETERVVINSSAKVNDETPYASVAFNAAQGEYKFEAKKSAKPVHKINVDDGKSVLTFDVSVSKDGSKIVSGDTEYTVTLFVGTGKENVSVYHNGELMTTAGYNAETGLVTFTTTHFSEFAVAFDKASSPVVPEPPVVCEHNVEKTYESNVDGLTHKVICQLCKKVIIESETHDFANGNCVCGEPKPVCEHNLTYANNGDTYTATCTKCNEVIIDSEAHIFADYKTTSDTEHSANCICGATDTAAHTFSYTKINDNSHTKFCAGCDYSITEAHTYVDGKCVCDANEPCKHTNHNYTNNEDGTHKVTCSDCGEVMTDKENCEYGSFVQSSDDKHTKTCAKCGGTVSEDCVYGNDTYTPAENDNHKHTQTCTVCNREKEETVACEFSGWSNVEGSLTHEKVCDKCNNKVTGDCADNNDDYLCDDCGYVIRSVIYTIADTASKSWARMDGDIVYHDAEWDRNYGAAQSILVQRQIADEDLGAFGEKANADKVANLQDSKIAYIKFDISNYNVDDIDNAVLSLMYNPNDSAFGENSLRITLTDSDWIEGSSNNDIVDDGSLTWNNQPKLRYNPDNLSETTVVSEKFSADNEAKWIEIDITNLLMLLKPGETTISFALTETTGDRRINFLVKSIKMVLAVQSLPSTTINSI